jgi:hypothetical protein
MQTSRIRTSLVYCVGEHQLPQNEAGSRQIHKKGEYDGKTKTKIPRSRRRSIQDVDRLVERIISFISSGHSGGDIQRGHKIAKQGEKTLVAREAGKVECSKIF